MILARRDGKMQLTVSGYDRFACGGPDTQRFQDETRRDYDWLAEHGVNGEEIWWNLGPRTRDYWLFDGRGVFNMPIGERLVFCLDEAKARGMWLGFRANILESPPDVLDEMLPQIALGLQPWRNKAFDLVNEANGKLPIGRAVRLIDRVRRADPDVELSISTAGKLEDQIAWLVQLWGLWLSSPMRRDTAPLDAVFPHGPRGSSWYRDELAFMRTFAPHLPTYAHEPLRRGYWQEGHEWPDGPEFLAALGADDAAGCVAACIHSGSKRRLPSGEFESWGCFDMRPRELGGAGRLYDGMDDVERKVVRLARRALDEGVRTLAQAQRLWASG